MDSDSIPSSDFDPAHISGLRIGLQPALAERERRHVPRAFRLGEILRAAGPAPRP